MANQPRQSPLAGWRMYGLSDAYQPRPPVEFVVKGLLERGSLTILFGSPGDLKSFLLADLCCSVSSGDMWLPALPGFAGKSFSVEQGAVLWIDMDNGSRRTHDRLAALGRGHSLPPDAPLHYFTMPTPPLEAARRDQIEDLARIIVSLKATLVVIDNLGSVAMNTDENSSDMVPILAHFRWLAEVTGAAIVLIHHRRKANGQGSRRGDALRGHSSIEAALDLALLANREPNSQIVQLTPTKVRGADVGVISAQFTFENDVQGQLHTARFYAAPSAEIIVIKKIMDAVWACLDGITLNKGALIANAQEKLGEDKVGEKRIKGVIELMVEKDFLVLTVGDNNAHHFSRNPDKSP